MVIKDTLKELHQRLVLQPSSASQQDWLDLLDLYAKQENLNEDEHKIKTAFYRGYANDLVKYLRKYMPSDPILLH